VGLDERSSEQCTGIEQSRATILGLLDREHTFGIAYSRMALAGFSQGGALSLFTGLQAPIEKKLAGVLVMRWVYERIALCLGFIKARTFELLGKSAG